MISRMARAGRLHRVRAGVYAVRSEWEALAPWERYSARVHAVAQTWSAPVFCLESAAALRCLPVFGEPREIHLLGAVGTTWREGDVVVHGLRGERVVDGDRGLLSTSIDDTATDLCRVLPPAFALAVADHVLRLPGATPTDFAAHGRAEANRRGLRRLDWVQERATSTAESVGESVSRAVIEWLGCAAPDLQVEFHHEGVDDRVDFHWRGARVIGESDGYGKYDAADPDAMKAHFIREKRREDRLRRHEGGFVRWDRSDTIRWRPLDEKLGSADVPRIRPRQDALLATLASNPRSFAPSASRQGIYARTG